MKATAVLLGLLVLAAPGAARAAGWGAIEPGVTMAADVRARYGAPTRETPKKVEGYDTLDWVYEGNRAPTGMVRMTVEFGLLKPDGYKPTLVRVLRLEPKPLIFPKGAILDGWGAPDDVRKADQREIFFYREGLLVTFDDAGVGATSLHFIVPQVPPAERQAPAGSPPAAPTAPAPAPPPRRP